MSVSLHHKFGATISLKNASRVMLPGFKSHDFLSEKLEDLWELNKDDFLLKLKSQIDEEIKSLPKWQKEDVLNHLEGGSRFSIDDLINRIWHYDDILNEFLLMSPLDVSFSRFREDVDWYSGKMQNNEYFVVKSGFVKGVEGMQFSGKSNKDIGLIKGEFYSILQIADFYKSITGEKIGKMKKSELISNAQTLGFTTYITPFYYILVKTLGYLGEGVTLSRFNKALNLQVVKYWS